MGVPLANVPDPAGDCHSSYARHFAALFIDTFAGLGIHPDRYYWMSEIYPTGQVDPFIRTALDRAELVRDIYRRVSRVERPAGWLPVHVICPTCGKVGTTLARDWDGETVAFECLPNLVTWATGCSTTGRIAPFGGAAKLPWNLDWAAQWSLFGVTVEPCGKDLATAGGSRDRSDAIAREVFEREPPLNVPYEFLNIGGRKMSSSKGRGVAAHEIAEVVPPEQLRLLFVRPRPNHALEFDPDGTDAIPRLFDESDRIAAATAGREVKGELPPTTTASSPPRWSIPPPIRSRPAPRTGLPSPTLRCCSRSPASTSVPASRPRRASRSPMPRCFSSTSAVAPPAAGWMATRPTRRASRCGERPCRRQPPTWQRHSASR